MPSIDEAAAARAAAHADGRRRDTIDALLAERRGYVIRGLDDRVGQVDAQLARHGAGPDGEPMMSRPAETPTAETSAPPTPRPGRGRKAG